MVSFRDRTYCASPNCKNECGRKMTDLEKQEAKRRDLPVSYAYFCDKPHVPYCGDFYEHK